MSTADNETGTGPGRVDFFVSYTGADEAWATWVAEQLETAGHVVRVQAWDSPVGANFVVWISQQMAAAGRTIAICSPAYFESHWTTQEWTGALADLKLIPLRVTRCSIPDVLGTITYKDLFDIDEATALQRLFEATRLVEVARTSTGFPGAVPALEATAAFPGRLPDIFNVPPRNRHFTGRHELLDQVRAGLIGGGPVAVTALHGLGGVGKTQLAIEYAHRNAATYDLIWWIDAEQPTLIGEQLAALTSHLGIDADGQVTADAAEVLNWLRHNDRWLVVFDNAENPAAVRPWLPGGSGHVVITSRHHAWSEVAHPVELDVMSRPEAVELLSRRVPGIDPTVADALANELGDLPLGLGQAAGYLGTTGLSPALYLERFRARRAAMLARGHDGIYGGTIDAAWSLAIDQLAKTDPAAVQLLELCAHLGPEPIPVTLFADRPDLFAPPLADIVAGDDPDVDLDDTIGAVLGYSLARRTDDGLQVHRLVAAVIRAHQTPDHANETATTTRRLLVAHQPTEEPEDPASWPRWAQLLPHILNAPAINFDDPTTYLDDDTRRLLINAGGALDSRGNPRAASVLNTTLYAHLNAVLGDDHPGTLAVANNLAINLRDLGDFERARQLDEDSLDRSRRLLGDDHPDTLISAYNLAIDLQALGDIEGSRELNEDTLARRRRVLGDDHPDTLRSASNLAIDLDALGDIEGSRERNEDILARRRRVLGDDHLDTLISAYNLAIDLRALGDVRGSRELNEDTLARRRRVLGDDHPVTLRSASNVAIDLYALGDIEGSRGLNEDILARRRRVLGDDHPDTLKSANNLAIDLRALGDVEGARQLDEDTLTRSRRVLGDHHPETLKLADTLAIDMRALGDVEGAARLEAEVRKHRPVD